ncbi:hypothetical protein [Calidifontibacter indicus]|nr:hypothetical protein [Calidifontibacter indicus]
MSLYSASRTGRDPDTPPNAVHPQICWSWAQGTLDYELTAAQQQYCRDNP